MAEHYEPKDEQQSGSVKVEFRHDVGALQFEPV
jgi:hypothetical protein